MIKTIFQAACQDFSRGEGLWASYSPWISTLKSSICHTAQPLSRPERESIARACKDVRSAKKYVSERGKGKGGDGFIYYRRSVIWIFTIAAAEPGRDSVPRWRHRVDLTRSIAHGHPHLLQIVNISYKYGAQISSWTRSSYKMLWLLFCKYSAVTSYLYDRLKILHPSSLSPHSPKFYI